MFLCGGSRALWSNEAVVVRRASFVSSGRRTMAASTSETISLTGMVWGVGANLGPFSRRERSATVRGFCDKLITQFFLLMALGRSFSASILRFVSLFSCLALMLLHTDWDRIFKNCSNVDEISSVTKLDNCCLDSSKVSFRNRIRSWQIEILALIQCLLARSIMRLKTGWMPGGLNLKDLGIHWFAITLCVKCRWRWWVVLYVYTSKSRDVPWAAL